MTDAQKCFAWALRARKLLVPPVIEWAEANVVLPQSVRSTTFRISISPWLQAPLEAATDIETRIVTFCKPVQSGGSVVGEILLMYWIWSAYGFLQYNWSNDKRALERWESRIESIFRACKPINEKFLSLARFEGKKCEIDFGQVFFRMQGAFVPSNLDSDSVTYQINEEVHDWEPGHLDKARNRLTAVALGKSIDISNAGKKKDQLNQAMEAGTQENWMVKCPGCNQYHIMRTRWEKSRPDLGGLRYDADGARMGHRYDYNKIASTVRFQMPCGFQVRNSPLERRRLLNGKYSDPVAGSSKRHRSFTYEAVCVDYIDWLDLIKQKHDALFALNNGDPQPWRRYRTERECLFYDLDDAPLSGGMITLTENIKKNRDGLPYPMGDPFNGGKLRLFSLDRQQGEARAGEFPYWWLLIRDVALTDEGLHSLLVYEGRLETDQQVIGVLGDHQCSMWQGVADSGDDTTHVYLFCLQNGINAIKGGKEDFYTHQGHKRRIFSPFEPLHAMLNRPPKYPYIVTEKGQFPDPREPMFWLYSKSGIRERLYWLRGSTKYEVPSDVSEEYQAHQEAEKRVVRQHPRTGEDIAEYHQIKRRNDQYVNEAYIAMQIEMAGLTGEIKPQ